MTKPLWPWYWGITVVLVMLSFTGIGWIIGLPLIIYMWVLIGRARLPS